MRRSSCVEIFDTCLQTPLPTSSTQIVMPPRAPYHCILLIVVLQIVSSESAELLQDCPVEFAEAGLNGQSWVGASVPCVTALQRGLNVIAPPSPLLKSDGILGPLTTKAVKAFQQTSGVKVDGVIGPATSSKLNQKYTAYLTSLSGPPRPASPPPGNEGYTALGDSYSAGVGAGDLTSGSCRQAKTSSWPYYLSQKLGYFQGFTLAACSGAKTEDVYDQIRRLSPAAKAAKLITITVGGNDILFADTLRECSSCNSLRECLQGGRKPCDISKASEALTLLPDRLEALFEKVDDSFSGKVYVVGYPDIIPQSNDGCGGFLGTVLLSDADREGLRTLVDPLNNAIRRAALQKKFTFVNVKSKFAGHQVCTEDNAWIVSPTDAVLNKDARDAWYHPNVRGQQAYADVVLASIEN